MSRSTNRPSSSSPVATVDTTSAREVGTSANRHHRKRSRSCSSPSNIDDSSNSNSSVGVLDPECDNGDDHIRDENDESDESRYSGGRHRHYHSASWFPSQIDVAISSGVGVADATTTLGSNTIQSNQINEMMMEDFQSSSESVDDDLSHEASHSPPERIRYELLGAPTLLYRHAPSYLCPSHRPSTLSPQQIFMAIYTKDHPVKDWFGPKSMTAHSNNQCPFLSCTNVPYPARPWGCTSTIRTPPPDSSDDQRSDKKVEAKSRYQQMVDEPNKIRNGEKESAILNNITSNGVTEAGRRQSKRMKDETKTNAPKKKKTSAFNVYRQEVSIKRKEEGCSPYTMKELGTLWKAIADAEKSRYQQMADEYNSNCMGEKQRKLTTAFIVYRKELCVKCKEEGRSGPQMTEVVNRWKKVPEDEKARYQQMADEYNSNCMGEKKRKLLTSAYIVYRKELGVKCKEKGCSGPQMKEVANRWKKVPEEEKARYQQMADEYNASRIGEQKKALNLSYEIDIEVETESALPNNQEDGMMEKAQKQRKSSTSAFNVFGKDLNINCKAEGCSRPQLKEVATRWKKGSEEEKARYQPMAGEQNAMKEVNEGNGSLKEEDIKTDGVVDTNAECAHILISPPIPIKPMKQVVPNEVGGPSGFGNCLITICCQCHYCNLRQPSWFLVHPTGDNLSRMAMSKLSLPRGVSRRVDQTVKYVLEIGGSILQISQCGPRLKSTDGIVCLVARTSQHCSIVYAHPTNIMTSEEQKGCGTNYELQEKARIDLSYCPSQTPHLPAYIACDPKTTVSYFTCPSIAILSRDDPERCTTIHRVIVRDGDEPTVKVHSISASLSDISILEFCSDDRLSLWAAARSTTMPKLTPGFFKQSMGPLAGYGHSLHRINLRDDSSSLIWSPSHADYFIEGLHSINGIMTDANNEHLVWVSSTSACKMWALDVRHRPAKVVVSWSLPSLCDDIGSQLPVSGIFGRGVIFSQPASIHSMPMNDASPVMFSVKKDPTTSVLVVHQLPSQLPRFQAKSLESAGFQEGSHSSIASSAVLPLPDISGSVFNIGLATVHCSVLTCLNEKQRRLLDYRIPPAHVTYVITMTSLGDMYCHTLLEANAAEQSLAQQYPGLPIGTKAIPFPGKLNNTPAIPGHLSITLNNKFPIPSSAITPHIILKSDDCCPFKSYDIKDILNREPLPEMRLPEPDDSTEQSFEYKAPRSMYDLRSSSVTNHSDFDISSTTFRVACCHGEKNDCDINSKSAFHPFPRFGMVLPTEVHSRTSSHCRNNKHHITLDPKHLAVSTCAEKQAGGYDSSDESGKNSRPLSTSAPVGKRPNEELDLDIFNNLQASYFRKDDANEFEFGAVKYESSSDSE